LSLAVGAVQAAVAEQVPAAAGRVIAAGTLEIEGAWTSFTVTVKDAVELFPPSVAVKVTVVVPTGKKEPLGMSGVTVALAQASVAVGEVQETTAPHEPLLEPTTMFAGTPEITGAPPSTTVTVKIAEAEFPLVSVAV
jgi:hypothetical protein